MGFKVSTIMVALENGVAWRVYKDIKPLLNQGWHRLVRRHRILVWARQAMVIWEMIWPGSGCSIDACLIANLSLHNSRVIFSIRTWRDMSWSQQSPLPQGIHPNASFHEQNSSSWWSRPPRWFQPQIPPCTKVNAFMWSDQQLGG